MGKGLCFRLGKLTMALAACYPLAGHTAAGVMQFVIGEVSIRRGGSIIVGVKGTALESGDGLATGPTGRAQIRFSDGGFISLQPNTKFEVTRYADTGDNRQDKFLVKLAEGGLRAITGAIGHRDHANYQVETPTALIGIRGSSFTAFYDPQDRTLRVANEQDAIEVCTAGGCVGLTPGETVLVNPNSANQQPTRTNYRPTLPLPVPLQLPQTVANQATPSGEPAVVVEAPLYLALTRTLGQPATPQPSSPIPSAPLPAAPGPVPVPPPPPTPPVPPIPAPPVPTPPAPVPAPPAPLPPAPSPSPTPAAPPFPGQSVSGINFTTRNANSTTATTSSTSSGVVQFDTSGNPLALTSGSTTVSSHDANNTPVYQQGDVNSTSTPYFAIGNWNSYTPAPPGATPLSYAIGVPTPVTTLASANSRAVYDMATLPTRSATPIFSSSSNVSPGYVDSARLVVDFFSGSNAGQLAMDVVMPPASAPSGSSSIVSGGDTTYLLRGSVNGTGSGFSGSLANTSTACTSGTITCSSASVLGFFSGDNADRAGLSFNTSSSAHGFIGGSVALEKTSSVGLANPSTAPSPSSMRSFFTIGSQAGGRPNPGNDLLEFSGAQLTRAVNGSTPTDYTVSAAPGTTSSSGFIGDASAGATDDAVPGMAVGWGYWSAGDEAYSAPSAMQDAHYVVGIPTTIASLPQQGTSSYSLVAGSVPTLTSGGTTTFGTLRSATLNANFFALTVKADVTVNFGSDILISRTLRLDDTSSTSNGATFSGPTATDNIAGFFSGNSGQYAGIVYSRDDAGLGGRIGGAATLALSSASVPSLQSGLQSAFGVGDGSAIASGTVLAASATPAPQHYLDFNTSSGKLLNSVALNSYTALGAGNATQPFPTTQAGAEGTPGSASFIGWGYWASGALRSYQSLSEVSDVHYVVGQPTVNMPSGPSAATVTYNTVVGQTTPTFTSTSTPGVTAALNLASLTANFSSGTVAATVGLTLTGASPAPQAVTVVNSGTISGSTFTASGTGTASGIFIGDTGGASSVPTRVGLVYSQDVNSGSYVGRVAGAVALKP